MNKDNKEYRYGVYLGAPSKDYEFLNVKVAKDKQQDDNWEERRVFSHKSRMSKRGLI